MIFRHKAKHWGNEGHSAKTFIETSYPEWTLDRVVKIPNNDRLMKLVCSNVRVANDIIDKGIIILNQKFAGRSLEKEIYVSVTPCLKCYGFDHITKKCKTREGYKICSSCSKEGHRYNDCKGTRLKCINCGQSHKTMAFKCPKRKEHVKKKLAEMKQKKVEKEKVSEPEIRAAVVKQMQSRSAQELSDCHFKYYYTSQYERDRVSGSVSIHCR